MLKIIPFSLNVPVSFSGIKLNFNIRESLRTGISDFRSVPHSHNDWEIRYVSSGAVTQYIDGAAYRLTAGDVIVLQPRTTHYQTKDSVSTHLTQFCIRISIKNGEEEKSKELEAILSNAFLSRDDQGSLTPLFAKLWNEIKEKKPGYFHYIQSVCLSLFIEFLRIYDTAQGCLLKFDDTKYSSYWYDMVDYYLHDNFMRPIKLEDLAEEIHLSPRHASRMVIKVYGVSFIQKLTEIRLDSAKYYLKHTDHTLNTIAQECGFSSYSYFTSCFKKKLGITPGEYRANTNNNSNSL